MLIASLCFGLVLAFRGPATAQESGEIRGRVTLPDSSPAVGATVAIPGSAHATRTDADGRFVLGPIDPGTHEVEVTLPGFSSNRTRVMLAAGETAEVSIALPPDLRYSETLEVQGEGPADRSTILKSGAPIVETPFSVTVIPASRIEEQKAQSLNEVLRYAPGVQSEQYGGLDQAFDFLTIRGFGGPSFDGLFRDGIQLYTFGFTGFRVEPYGAETIEVLRGAATVLYGRTGPGGLVNVVSKRPPAAALRELTLEGGNFGLIQGRFDFGAPFGSDAGSGWRITGLLRNSGTQVDFEENDRVFLAPALSFSSERTKVTFLGNYQKDRAGHFQFLPQVGTLDPSPNGVIPPTRADGEEDFDHFDRQQYAAGYELEHRLSDRLTLRQNTRFDHVDVDYQDVFGTGLDEGDPQRRLLTRGTFTILGDTDVLTVDSQAVVDARTGRLAHALLLGFDYQHSTFDSVDGFGGAPSLDVFDPVYGAPIVRPEPYGDARTTLDQFGLYAQDRIHLPGGIVALLSGRQNFLTSEIDDHLADTQTSEDLDKFVWQGGLAFTNGLGLVPHVSYSESFEPVAGLDASGNPYEPQTGQQYELGLRYQPAGQRLALSGAVFDLRHQNVLTSDPTNPANQIQTGEVASRGLELEADAAFAPGIRLFAAYTFQDVEITESNDGDQGLRPEAIPEHLASLWVNHEVSTGTLSGLGLGGGIRYQGSTLDETNTIEVEGATLVDAVLSYRLERLRFALNVQNVFDKTPVAACSFGNCYYGRSRTVYGNATFAW